MTDIATIDRLTSKIKRAKKHIIELEACAKEFIPNGGKDFIRFEDDLNKQERSYYLLKLPVVLPDVPLIIGDVLQNLRSALDHLACHLVTANGGTVTSQTCFPIAETAAKYQSAKFRRKIEGARPDAIKYLDSFQPYKGGTHLLWELHELNKIDKHRLLLTTCSTNVAHSMSPNERMGLEQLHRNCHPAAPAIRLRNVLKPIGESDRVALKVGDKLLTIPHSQVEQEMRFLIDIAFDEPQVIQRKSVVKLLVNMSNKVLDIVTGLSLGGFL